MRMRILSERSESKDLSSHLARIAVLRSIARFVRPGWAYGATKDLSTHPMRMRILPTPSISGSESAAADEPIHDSDSVGKDLSSEFDVQMLRRSDVAFPRSDALFVRSCRSWSKECLRNLLK
jgi:hypothetical protein